MLVLSAVRVCVDVLFVAFSFAYLLVGRRETREERRAQREVRREKSAERSEKREEITKKAARDPQLRLFEHNQLTD